jgi:hypothetical protein
MSPTPRSVSEDAARGEPVRPARRPLAVRGVQDLPAPRVVLHLPDLEALTSVALGPPQPAARRRVDPPHVVRAAVESESAAKTAGTASTGPTLVNLFKVPLDKLTAENIVQGGKKLGQIALWLQQPKMMLAAVAAVALQLAAVLAMLTGTGDKPAQPTGDGPRRNEHAQHGPQGGGIVDHRRPIQTPVNAPGQYSPMPHYGPGYGGPQRGPISVAQPSPPQPLPGVQPDELPAWPGAAGPSFAGSPADSPANRGSAATTIAPQGNSTPAMAVGESARTNGPKPKLKGTILKVNEAAR